MPCVNEDHHSNESLGLVISYFGNSVAVEADDGQVFQCHLRRNQALPVVGDRVYFESAQGDTGLIKKIVERHSLLARGDSRGQMKPLAANIDVIFIVMAPDPVFSEYLVDRYLVAAALLAIKPVIVLNKIDLLDEESKANALNRLEAYQSVPYPVILSSIYTPHGLKELAFAMADKTGVLVGPSGVGKSSIIAALGESNIRVQAVSKKGAGKHTTTATTLYHLPQGGNLIDSPGVREFNLWPVDKKQILKAFQEFAPFVSACKFRDCSHQVEPGCAVKQAATEGRISRKRLENYQTLIKNV